MKSKLLSLIGLLLIACVMPPSSAPASAPLTLNPGYKWTVTGHIGTGSSQAHDIYTSTDCQDAEYLVKTLQAFGYDHSSDAATVRQALHVTSVTVINVINLPGSYVQFPSENDVIINFQISLAFID